MNTPFAAVVLAQHGDLALERAEDGAVDHDGVLGRVFVVLELEPEAQRQLEVELDRRALVLALQRVIQLDIDLFGTKAD